MARSRYRPISEKNYFVTNGAALPSGSLTALVIADADDGITDNSIGIPGRVKAVFIESAVSVDVLGIGGTMGIGIVKDIGGNNFGTFNPNGQPSNEQQQQLIYFLRMSPSQSNNPFRLFGWLKIPRRHAIFNEGDKLRMNISVTTVGGSADYSHCTTFIYKHQKA